MLTFAYQRIHDYDWFDQDSICIIEHRTFAMCHRIAVICLSMLLCVAELVEANVVISQILYDSPYNEQITKYPYSDGEFVELYNAGTEDADLGSWQLWGGGVTERYSFPEQTILPAGGYLAVAFHNSTVEPSFHLATYSQKYKHSKQYPVLEQKVLILSNTGELLSLRNALSEIVDSIRYKKQKAALNADCIPYMECKSLHRISIRKDLFGTIQNTMDDWEIRPVDFGGTIPVEQMYVAEDAYHYTENIAGNNYCVRVIPLDEATEIRITDGNVSGQENARLRIDYTYYDGLGREVETIQRRMTPQGKDIVSLVQHNAAGQITHTWLPMPINGAGYVSPTDLQNAAMGLYADNAPYRRITYEASPLNKQIAITQAGITYQDHPATIADAANTANEVTRFEVSARGLEKKGYYAANSLYKSIQADEDGKEVTTYTDILGRTIMQQIGKEHRTYYVYDTYNRLRYVLPTRIVETLPNGDVDDNQALLRQYGYVYRYDARDRMIYKRMPGCEPVYMVYDKGGKLILAQDGNQRQQNRWTYRAYDAIDRPIYTAEITLQSVDVERLNGEYLCDTIDTQSESGYTNRHFTDAPLRWLTINYYDDYGFLQQYAQDTIQALAYAEQEGYDTPYSNTRGRLTGQRIYSLTDSNQYDVSVLYYDQRGQVVQSRSTTPIGNVVRYYAYHHDGTIRQTKIEHGNHTEQYRYMYDFAGRPTKTIYQLDERQPIVLAVYGYDELGRPITKLRHNGTDRETYQYDMREQLTNIQSGDFSEQIYYADSVPINTTACYNGNLSANTIEQGGHTLDHRYRYDMQNRLILSARQAGEEEIPSEVFEYDPLGNITQLKRYENGTLIDALTMYYEGNQLTNVRDGAGNQDRYAVKEYTDRADLADAMRYDGNGNLTKDLDRQIDTIYYNLLNLPEKILFANGNCTEYQYGANGQKQRAYYRTMTEPLLVGDDSIIGQHIAEEREIWYCGNREKYRVRKPGSVWRWYKEVVHNDEGYTEFALNDTSITNMQQYYYRKDHLGNIVAVWNATREDTPQRTFYYASGLPMSISMGQDLQARKYGGKEFDEMHRLDEYDSEARRYYPAVCRTTTMDPLCEEYYATSPYAWCGNNPVNRIDPTGMEWYQNDSSLYYTWFDKEVEQKGYTHIGGIGSVLGEFEPIIDNLLTNVYHTDGLYTNGRSFDIAPADKGALIGSKERGWDFLDEFVFNEGPEISILLSNHPYTQQMMKEKQILDAQTEIHEGSTNVVGQYTGGGKRWGVIDVINPLNWTMAQQFIGSYRYDIYTSGNGVLFNNVVSDSKSVRSLFYHIVPDRYNKDRKFYTNCFGNTYQFYIWQFPK